MVQTSLHLTPYLLEAEVSHERVVKKFEKGRSLKLSHERLSSEACRLVFHVRSSL